MAQEEPDVKKFKRFIISEQVYCPDFEELFREHWENFTAIRTEDLEVISKPFRVCRISNFFESEEFIDELKNELLDVKSRRACMDLYQFEQTGDLANVNKKNIQLLYETFQADLASWMERNVKIDLNHNMSMSSTCYTDTDYLLCHDDNMGNRRIAFIFYLSNDWTPEDGGALDLFDTDEDGQPRNVVYSLFPQHNSLVFFEVVDNSYHQVAEVTSAEKSRWTINGWFHGSPRKSSKPPRPVPTVNFVKPEHAEVDLNEWVSQCYLFPGIIKEIQEDMEQDSYAFLSNFLRKDVYERLSMDVNSQNIRWRKVGPADVQNYEIADEDTLPENLKAFYNIFKSITIFRLLKNYTELDLVPDDEHTDPKMTIELQRWSRGCYTLLCDRLTPYENTSATSEENAKTDDGNVDTEQIGDGSGTSKACGESESKRESPPTEVNENVGEKIAPEPECDTLPSGNGEGDDEDDVLKQILKSKSPWKRKMVISCLEPSSSKSENTFPEKAKRCIDTDYSDESDIGDYLSDEAESSSDNSDRDEDREVEESNESEPGSLDVIMQFHSDQVAGMEIINYVDPKEQEGALIQVPSKDNHLCLVYATQSTCRVHKYVNHYCKGYFYNLICTYYE